MESLKQIDGDRAQVDRSNYKGGNVPPPSLDLDVSRDRDLKEEKNMDVNTDN